MATTVVTGATGRVGRRVVDGLLRAGAEVRAVTRDPGAAGLPDGARVVAGDPGRPETLAAALEGADAAYLFPVSDTAAAGFARLASAAGVGRIVVLSSVSAGGAEGDHSGDHHRAVERAVEASGVTWTHVRPGEFMANVLDWWAAPIRDEGVVREPFPRALHQPVHEDDIADVAVAALLEDGHAGAAYALLGPEVLTTADQVRLIGAALGRDIRFEELTREQARRRYVEHGVPPEVADWLLAVEELPEGTAVSPATGPTAEAVTGRPARTFAQWAADHAGDFR
jgi:uncharacterized protein YbjT (DUF2867 family)